MEILDSDSAVVMPTNNSTILATTTLSAPSTTSTAQPQTAGELVVRLRQKRPTEINISPTATTTDSPRPAGKIKVDQTKLSATKSVSEGNRPTHSVSWDYFAFEI